MPVIPIVIAAASAVSGAAAAAGTAAAAAAGTAAATAAAAAGTAAATVGTAAAAVTATDVIAAGAVGYAAKKVKDKYDEKKVEEGYQKGASETAAKLNKKMEKIEESLKEFQASMKDINEYFKLIVALSAVGMATAFADGKISDEELIELDEFTTGIANTALPSHIKEAISQLKANPPSFNTSMEYVKNLKTYKKELFELVIEVIAESDGHFCKDEKALLAAFRAAV